MVGGHADWQDSGMILGRLFLLLLALAWAGAARAEIRVAYLGQAVERPPTLSTLDASSPTEGLDGARLGMADNATTGKFLKQTYALDEVVLPADGDVAAAVSGLAARGHRLVIADLGPEALLKAAAAPGAEKILFFNAGATDDRLRNQDCHGRILHTAPSRAMLADALAQVLVAKRWTRWLLVVGPRPADALYAEAIRRAAGRFGAKIVEEKRWSGEFDLRRAAQAEIPVFTRGAGYDVLVVADELGDFGEFLPYNTWDPRPVAGTHGLMPAGWHRSLEQWGAIQLQNRFRELARRPMEARDYAAWVAARAIGEAATRTRSEDPAAIEAVIRSPDFELAAFKGRKLSFRDWDGQLRQPVPLTTAKALVALAPQEGFLHPVNEMDTLGHDRPETGCRKDKGR